MSCSFQKHVWTCCVIANLEIETKRQKYHQNRHQSISFTKILRIQLPTKNYPWFISNRLYTTSFETVFFQGFPWNSTPASRVALKRPPLYLAHLPPRISGMWLNETEIHRPSIWGCCRCSLRTSKMEGFWSVFQRDLSLQNLLKLSGLSTC